ncbi:MAG: hypothetical protein GY697_16785 [Desulfobacterales bacterium]|nr:hypothetical protein [Desulfobacterales bacterium]
MKIGTRQSMTAASERPVFTTIFSSFLKNGFWFGVQSSLLELRLTSKAAANIKSGGASEANAFGGKYSGYFEDLI